MRRLRGFTLLELMIAVAIVSILGAIALPSYQSSIRKGRRADAADAAAGVLQKQELWRSNNASYSTSLATLSPAVASTSSNGYYGLALSNVTTTGYTLTFTPVAAKGQNNDTGCTSLVVTVVTGNPTYTPAACWSR